MDINLDNTRLETKRLLLRAFRETDLFDFNAYASVPGVGAMAGWKAHRSVDESRHVLKLFMDGKKTFALELKATGKVIGSIGIEPLEATLPQAFDNFRGRSIGYVLSRDFWGQGLVPEAVKAVVDYSFHDLGLDFLTCSYFLENLQSRRVTEKCGFEPILMTLLTTHWGEPKDSMLTVLWNPRASKRD